MKTEYASIVYESLKEAGINFVAYLPDDQIHDAQKLVVEDPDFISVAVANEGEKVEAAGKRMATGMDGKESKYRFVRYIESSEGIKIIDPNAKRLG